jgi:mono/diheme cytochrome c family protein
MKNVSRLILAAIAGLIILFGLIQLIPYGRNHTNPPVVAEPKWDSPRTKELAQRACFDCHSNETVWPWYSNVAPISWLVQRDVDEGRRRLNFSEWGSQQRAANEVAGIVLEGEMPPFQYLPTHPEARLSQSERQELAQGLQATLGSALLNKILIVLR